MLEKGAGWCDVANAPVVSMIVIMIHESANLEFKIVGQVIIFKENPVLERLMPSLDFSCVCG